MSETLELTGLAARADRLSLKLGWWTDRAAAVLLAVLILDVWLGVFARYILPLPITFMEEAARYLMIWVALLAVSSCIPRREHIGVQVLFERLPAAIRRHLLLLLDLLGIVFFLFLAFYGVGLVERGAKTFTMISGMSKALPFAAVPVGATLAAIQLALVAIRDQARLRQQPLAVVFP
ncbi:TRAP transporter small permease [Piscinibacter sakaiensis]|uniref:TRAP transporter small permease n=1 Tax=Piscinibacter sakaiensis TaxID=1547922 RepID=UPI003AAC50CD